MNKRIALTTALTVAAQLACANASYAQEPAVKFTPQTAQKCLDVLKTSPQMTPDGIYAEVGNTRCEDDLATLCRVYPLHQQVPMLLLARDATVSFVFPYNEKGNADVSIRNNADIESAARAFAGKLSPDQAKNLRTWLEFGQRVKSCLPFHLA
jgi:hypothetical protein